MKTRLLQLVAGAAIAAGIAGALVASAPSRVEFAAAPPDTEALARKLVNECAAIKEGELVLISGGTRDQELLENIAVNVRQLGAFPLLTIGSDRLTKRLFDDVPAKFDTQTPELDMKLANIITSAITIEFNETEGLLSKVPPERLAAVQKSMMPVNDLMLRRGVKAVSLGNGIYPTQANATRYGLSKDELSRIFWSAVNADYSTLQSAGEAIKNTLASGTELHLTNPNGTDLTVKINKRPVFVSDGVISAADIKAGGPATQVWLPAGEVYTAPVAGSAEGTVVVNRAFFHDKEINDLRLTFKAGKVTAMTAKSGIDTLQKAYDAAGPGKDAFAVIDIGINSAIPVSGDNKLQAWMQAGMVTIGFGDNTWAGGENKVNFMFAGFCPGSTLTLDGKTIVDKGTLKTGN